MIEQTNNSLALVHQQNDQAAARQREIRDDIALSSTQLQELVETVKHLYEVNDDK